MSSLSIAEKYTLLALNDNGKFPAITQNYSTISLIVAAISDLRLSETISIDDDKKVKIIGDLPGNLEFLRPIYEYLKDKGSLKPEKILEDYTMGFSNRFDELLQSISNSLAAKGSVTKEEKSGILGDKILFIPNDKEVESTVRELRDEILEDGNISDDNFLLSSILERGKQLDKFFSQHESKMLKDKVEMLRNTEASSLIKSMTDDMNAFIIAVLAAI